VRLDQRGDGLDPQQGGIAVDQEHGTLEVGDGGQRDGGRMAGAALLLLDDGQRPGRDLGEVLLDRRATGADDDDGGAGIERPGRREDVTEHRPAADGVQHLGGRRAHAGALAGGEDDDGGDRRLALAVELAPGTGEAPGMADAIAAAVRDAVRRLSSEFAAYVPDARQTPHVTLWPAGHPAHFPVGVKHRYSRP